MKKSLLLATIMLLLFTGVVSAQSAKGIKRANPNFNRLNNNRLTLRASMPDNKSLSPKFSKLNELKITTGDGLWISNGPYGGLVFSFAIDTANNIIYAGTRNGVWKSNNGGENWELSLAPEDVTWGWAMVNSISILKDNPDIVYVVCSNGLYKSTNGGLSWTQMTTTGTFSCVQTLKHNNNEMVFASIYSVAIKKSNNGGISWDNITPYNLSPSGPMVVNPDNPDIIYAGANCGGVYKTTTGDTNWVQLNNGIPTDLSVVALKQNPKNPNTLYACMNKLWPEQTGLPGLYKSYDGGESWELLDLNCDFYNSLWEFDMIAINPSDTNTVFIAYDGTLFKSYNGGKTFSSETSELLSGSITVGFDPADSQLIYLGKYIGVSKSYDGGNVWEESSHGMLGATPTKVAINQENQDVLFVGSNSYNGVDKSQDGGLNWQMSNTGLPSYGSVTIDPNNQETLFCLASENGIFKSTNSGDSWTQLTDQPIYTYEINHSNSNIQYGAINNVFYKSYDGGAIWNEISTISGGMMGDGSIVSIASDPGNTDILYCGTQLWFSADMFGGLYKSTDSGVTWTQLVTDQAAVKIAIDPNNSNVVYYGTCENGLFKSTDGGLTWNSLTTGLGTGENLPYISDILINTENSNILYVGLQNNFYKAGVHNNGIYKSTDAGLTWEVLPMDGLLWKDVENLSLSPDNTKLYASIQCGGVFFYDIISNIKEPASENKNTLHIFPNPIADNATVTFRLASNSNITLRLYDINGRYIVQLADNSLPQGTHSLSFNFSGINKQKLSAGVYYLQLQTNYSTETIKVIVR